MTQRFVSVGLLLLFVAAIRLLPSVARPASSGDHCDTILRGDVAAMERCLAQQPDNVELMLDLASGFEQAGQRDRSVAMYKRALAVDPEDGEVRRRLDALR